MRYLCGILVILFLCQASLLFAGVTRESFNRNLKKFETVDFGSADDDPLIKEIIEAYHQLDPKPALPPQAETFLFQGEAAVEMAKDKEEFQIAIDELVKALRIAPWSKTAYFNLAVVYEKSGQFDKAALNFERYLWTAPGASDQKEVRKKIVKLKFKENLAKKQKIKENGETQKRLKEEESTRLLEAVTGEWTGYCTNWPEPKMFEFSVEEDIVRHRIYIGIDPMDGMDLGWSGWEQGTRYDFDKNMFAESTWHANEDYIWVRSGTLMERINKPTGKITCTYKR